MKKKLKIGLAFAALFLGATVLTSCTASFCSNEDTARIMYTFDKGTTKYYKEGVEGIPEEAKKLDGFTDVYYVSAVSNSTIIKSVVDSNPALYTPSLNYYIAFDTEARNIAIDLYKTENNFTETINYDKLSEILDLNSSKEDLFSKSHGFGYTRFKSKDSEDLFSGYDAINTKLKEKLAADPTLEYSLPTSDFVTAYKKAINTKVSAYRSCINTTEGYFGNFGENGEEPIYMQGKDWGYAWSKGFLEGLLIYPIAYMADYFTMSFAGSGLQASSNLAAGWPQLLSILFVTLIVRSIILLCTFKSTLGQSKMQEMQPQLAKLQQKYPNANTNNYEKQKLAQEQMRLYKKNKIHPFSSIIVIFIQFPIFICVWGALSGSAALATGSFLNLNLASTVYTALFNVSALPSNSTGWWTALCLFIIMSVFQFVATKFPQWMNKNNTKNVKKLGKSNTANQQEKTMKIVQYVMLVMIIVMGFTLPAAMGVYWIVSAIFSILQTLLITLITRHKSQKGKE